MKAEKHPNVHVTCIEPADVTTQSHHPPPVWWLIAADPFCSLALAKAGSGRYTVIPYWKHGVLKALIDFIPASIIDEASEKRMHQLRALERAKKKNL